MMTFSFSTDALLLGHFTKPRTKDIVLDLCSGQWGDTLVIVCETSTTYRRC